MRALSLALIPAFLAVLSLPGSAQKTGLVNGSFEKDRVGGVPEGWVIPKPCMEAGYALEVTRSTAAGGKQSAVLHGQGGDPRIFGNCMQGIEATPFRGKRVRFSAAVRCEPADGESRAQLWLRVDRPEKKTGFFDNMGDRPIRDGSWQRYEIVGDIAEDAHTIVLGLMLLGGGGTAGLDDARLEVVDGGVATTGAFADVPGLVVLRYAAEAKVMRDSAATRLSFPLPLAYRDQTPLTFRLEIEPAATDARVAITEGPGPNRVLELELRNLLSGTDLVLRYESVVLVAPSSFDEVPATFPASWPEEARPWLEATWCCDSADPRIRSLGAEIRAAGGGLKGVIDGVLARSQSIIHAATGRVQVLTAVEALDKQGSCTSCANLVAALLRAAGVPARILAGYPLWSGPLQTHYIVEAFLPGQGWYPLESTRGLAPWPNSQQVNVSIVPVEHEGEALAGARPCAGGAVPFLSLTEYGADSALALQGTLKPGCDHEARLLRPLEASAAAWSTAQKWARARWAQWLTSEPELRAGQLAFGPASDGLTAKTLAELRSALK